MTAATPSPSRARLARLMSLVVGGATALFGACLCPLLLPYTLAVGPLDAADIAPLWTFSLLFLAIGALAASHRWPRLTLLLLPVSMLVGLEVGTRLWVRCLGSADTATLMLQLAFRTYPDSSPYQAHPFLQFTGQKERRLSGKDVLGDAFFNNLGFIGPDVVREKPADVVRVAFIGGSTTATGYFHPAERRLNELAKDSGKRFQCYSFALGCYTSVHSVVNFVLNVIDYQPDYVVFMHGWNDMRARDNAEDFRGDYSNAYKAFEPAPIPDAWLIRASVIYRYLKYLVDPTPASASLVAATSKPKRPGMAKAPELSDRAYLRNVKTIVEVAHANGIFPVLVTQAHSTDPKIAFAWDAEGIGHYSELLRQAAATYGDRVLFVDFDRMITGKHNEWFRDVGHHNAEGVEFTGEAVADAIYGHWSKR